MMNFDNIVDFGDFVAENIKQFLPEQMQDVNFRFMEVQKKNDITLYGLMAINEDTNLSPTIYLNRSFEDVQVGKISPLDAVKDLAVPLSDAYLNPSVRGFNHDLLNDFEAIKTKIMPSIISLDKNMEYLSDKPHEIIGDLAKIYKISVDTTDLTKASINVTNNLLNRWGISKETLDQVAMENLSFERFQFKSLSSFLANLMGMSEEQANLMFPAHEPPIYILTNEKANNGAIGILNRPIMDKISAELGSDLVILPSSVHETLILPFNYDEITKDINALKNMVKGVNATEVSSEEFLSDNVYAYDAKEHELMLADKYVERIHMRENAQDFINLDQKTVNVIMGDGRPAGTLIGELNSKIDKVQNVPSAKKHEDIPIGG